MCPQTNGNVLGLGNLFTWGWGCMGYGILNEDLTEPYIKDILKLIIATSFNLANDLLVLKFFLIIFGVY